MHPEQQGVAGSRIKRLEKTFGPRLYREHSLQTGLRTDCALLTVSGVPSPAGLCVLVFY